MENQRAVTLMFIAGAVLVGVFASSLVGAVMGYAALEDPILAGLLPLSTLVGVATSVIGFFVGLRVQKATVFADEVVTELGKVSWPTREETSNNTTIVVGATIFFSGLLAVYDFAWARLTGLFLYNAG